MRKLHLVTGCVLFGLVAAAGCGGGVAALPSGATAGAADRIHYALSLSGSPVSPDVTDVPYDGGPVILAPKFYLTFWGYKKRRSRKGRAAADCIHEEHGRQSP